MYLLSWFNDELFLTGNPQGKWGVYKFVLGTSGAQFLVSLPESGQHPVITPDQQWVLYNERYLDSASHDLFHLVRVPINGGAAPAQVLDGKLSLRCASQAKTCVLLETGSGKSAFYILDPLKGRGAKLLEASRVVRRVEWSVAPDGNSIAFVEPEAGRTIEILPLNGKPNFSIETKVWVDRLEWPTDNQHLYVAANLDGQNRSQVLRFNLAGESKLLLQMAKGQALDVFLVSPDEKYVAYCTFEPEKNVTLLENF